MRTVPPSILFISHDASRTGAPVALLTLLRWMRSNTDYELQVLLGAGGALETAFASVAPTSVVDTGFPRLGRLTAAVPPAALSALRGLRFQHMKRRLAGADLLYSNTLQNGALLGGLWQSGTRVLSHVHELEWWLGYKTEPSQLDVTKRVTDRYVACSRAALENLVETHGVQRERVTLCHAFIELDEIALSRARARRQATRHRLSIPGDAPVVGAIGTMDWRKGPDLFVQLAHHVTRRLPRPEVHFLWAGGDTRGPVRGGLLADARKLGLGQRIRFVGPSDEPAELVAAMDVFALTSREDPFPLVMLEAAAAGLPIVCFDGGGGAPEFVLPDAGVTAGYLDVAAMADAVVHLLENEEERRRMGRVAATRVRDRHTVARAGPILAGVIDRTLDQPGCDRWQPSALGRAGDQRA